MFDSVVKFSMELPKPEIQLLELIDFVKTELERITVDEQPLFTQITTLAGTPVTLQLKYNYSGQDYIITIDLDQVSADAQDIYDAQVRVREIVRDNLRESGVYQQPSQQDVSSISLVA